MDTVTCMELAKELPVRGLALYSHLVPAIIAVFLGLYALRATKRSQLSLTFLAFTFAVSLWLVSDLLLWTFPGYDLVAYFWSWIDFVDVVFFVLAAFFFSVLAHGKSSTIDKTFLFVACIPSFYFTVTGTAVTALSQPWCEMYNNDTAVLFKQLAEWAAIVVIIVSMVKAWGRSDAKKKKALAVVCAALLLFLATFSVTEYLAAQTAVYEINLYGLFILPVFLIMMVFAITNLEVFKMRYLGTQLLVYILILLVASQFLFLQSSTDALLNGLTLALTVVIGLILLQNEKQQVGSLVRIETLAKELTAANTHLQELNQLKSQFLSFASHQLRAPLTAIKWQSQLLLDGTVGKLPESTLDTVREIESAAGRLVSLVNEFLDLRKLQEGKMEYRFEPTDVAKLVEGIVNELKQLAVRKGLALTFEQHAKSFRCSVDRQQFAQVIQNLVDNAIKYTDSGAVTVRMENSEDGSLDISVTDTGHGIDPAAVEGLFEQFTRGAGEATKIEGTGLGLYIARRIVTAHHGRVWATSQGPGHGSTFTVRITPLAS